MHFQSIQTTDPSAIAPVTSSNGMQYQPLLGSGVGGVGGVGPVSHSGTAPPPWLQPTAPHAIGSIPLAPLHAPIQITAAAVDEALKAQMDRARAKFNEIKPTPPASAGAVSLPPELQNALAAAAKADESKRSSLAGLSRAVAAVAAVAGADQPTAMDTSVSSAVGHSASAEPLAVDPLLQSLKSSLLSSSADNTTTPPVASPTATTTPTAGGATATTPTPTPTAGGRRRVTMGGSTSLMDLQRKRTGATTDSNTTPTAAAAASNSAAAGAASRVIGSNQYVSLVHMSDASGAGSQPTGSVSVELPSLSMPSTGPGASPVVTAASTSPQVPSPSTHTLMRPPPARIPRESAIDPSTAASASASLVQGVLDRERERARREAEASAAKLAAERAAAAKAAQEIANQKAAAEAKIAAEAAAALEAAKERAAALERARQAEKEREIERAKELEATRQRELAREREREIEREKEREKEMERERERILISQLPSKQELLSRIQKLDDAIVKTEHKRVRVQRSLTMHQHAQLRAANQPPPGSHIDKSQDSDEDDIARSNAAGRAGSGADSDSDDGLTDPLSLSLTDAVSAGGIGPDGTPCDPVKSFLTLPTRAPKNFAEQLYLGMS